MNYVYPKLSEHDLGVVRLGGAGLGNILFPWARAAVFARDSGCRMIWPTWPSIKLGPILRREKDKRFYGDLFESAPSDIAGAAKLWKLWRLGRISESEKESISLQDETIVEFTGFEGCFEEILYDYAYVQEQLTERLREKNRRPFSEEVSGAVGIHVRLGDFARVSEEEVRKGRHDSALPIEWYGKMLEQIRDCVGREIPAQVFSDGTDAELAPLLRLPGVRRKSFGTSIADIVALSRFPLLIASGSSFSMWARYLGRGCCICYPGQRKQRILTPEEENFEIETNEAFTAEVAEKIRRLYRQERQEKNL